MRKREREPEPLVLVQTRVPKELATWAERQAARAHLSMAAWVRLRIWELYDLERNVKGTVR